MIKLHLYDSVSKIINAKGFCNDWIAPKELFEVGVNIIHIPADEDGNPENFVQTEAGKKLQHEILSGRYAPGVWTVQLSSFDIWFFLNREKLEAMLPGVLKNNNVIGIVSPEGERYSWDVKSALSKIVDTPPSNKDPA